MKITILGCGSSAGVPLIGCSCDVCTSSNPKNKRMRVSVYVETGDNKILIDTSPDLRNQALKNSISHIDAVLYTHDHADHVMGIDDLRSFNYLSKASLPIYGDKKTMDALTERFAYVFLPKPQNLWFRPSLIAHSIPEKDVADFEVHGQAITAFAQLHGKTRTLGYRIGDFAYSTDTDGLEDYAFAALAGIKVWVVDCLRYTKSHSHSYLAQTLEWIEKIKPELAIFTHMGHEFEYEKLLGELPQGVVPGYDGLAVEL